MKKHFLTLLFLLNLSLISVLPVNQVNSGPSTASSVTSIQVETGEGDDSSMNSSEVGESGDVNGAIAGLENAIASMKTQVATLDEQVKKFNGELLDLNKKLKIALSEGGAMPQQDSNNLPPATQQTGATQPSFQRLNPITQQVEQGQ